MKVLLAADGSERTHKALKRLFSPKAWPAMSLI
jgi:hypothetical protein